MESKTMDLEENKPKPKMIGKTPFYIRYAGVDRKTGEVVIPLSFEADKTNIRKRTDDFARSFGLERI